MYIYISYLCVYVYIIYINIHHIYDITKNEVCAKKDCELIKAVAEIFSL